MHTKLLFFKILWFPCLFFEPDTVDFLPTIIHF